MKTERLRKQMKYLLSKHSNTWLQAEYIIFERLLTHPTTATSSSTTQPPASLQQLSTAVQNSRTIPPIAGVKKKAVDIVDLTAGASDDEP